MVHFGVMVVVNIMIGLITPPYGLLLFIMTRIAAVPLRDLVRDVLPFLCALFASLALITVFPDLVLWLPRLLVYEGCPHRKEPAVAAKSDFNLNGQIGRAQV